MFNNKHYGRPKEGLGPRNQIQRLARCRCLGVLELNSLPQMVLMQKTNQSNLKDLEP